MEHIIARQNAAAKPATGKTFLLGAAQIIAELAVAQVIVHFLIPVLGVGLVNLLLCGFAVVLMVRFMKRTVAGSTYTLCGDKLVLKRLMGDLAVQDTEIPLEKIVSIRPYAYGQRLHLDYRRVTYVDIDCAPGLRMRAAFAVSLVWAWLARVIAGKKARREAGFVIVYMEGKKRRACAFKPDAAFVKALEAACPDAAGRDERLERGQNKRYFAKSLRRAFGDLYPHVPDAVTPEEIAFEREEFARRKEQKIENKARKKNIPIEAYRKQLSQKERKKAAAQRKRSRLTASIAGKLSFLKPIAAFFTCIAQLLAIEDPQDTPGQDTGEDAPRRRRGRQE